MKRTLLIATGNLGKVREIRHEFEVAAAAAHDSFLSTLTIVGLKDLPHVPPECVEDQPTFEGNARKKARHYAAFSGMLTLADDSGLCVDALGGVPGVYSARYAGVSGPGADAANNARLLAALDHIPDDQRQARFVCAMALASPAPPQDLALTTDQVQGILLRAPRGTNGFGYDPLFYFPQFSKTTAELDMAIKSQISHRGKALRKMIAWLHEHHVAPRMGSYQLLRETPWIKEWQTPRGAFIDSKLRWLGVEPSAAAFLGAWRAASPAERFDLEAAFEFYPYELEEDVQQILETIAREDQPRAQRMAQKHFGADAQLSAEQQHFLEGLGAHLEKAAASMRLVGENRWFAAYANDAGFHIDSRLATPLEMPTDAELQAHIDASLSLAYRRILLTVKENKWLLEPQAGAQVFPI